jgi:hypothetical protein
MKTGRRAKINPPSNATTTIKTAAPTRIFVRRLIAVEVSTFV